MPHLSAYDYLKGYHMYTETAFSVNLSSTTAERDNEIVVVCWSRGELAILKHGLCLYSVTTGVSDVTMQSLNQGSMHTLRIPHASAKVYNLQDDDLRTCNISSNLVMVFMLMDHGKCRGGAEIMPMPVSLKEKHACPCWLLCCTSATDLIFPGRT